MSTQSLKPSWKIVKFDDIAQNVAVRVDPADAKTDVYVGLEHLDPSTIHLRQWGHPSDVIGQKLAFKKGDVIFGRRRAYQRKLAVAELDGICSAHAMVVRAKPNMILPEFLPFFLQSDMFMERAIEISVGSLSPTINWKTLKIQEFPLPPIDEQKRIAEILWAADEAVETKSRVISEFAVSWQKLIDSIVPNPDDSSSRTVVRLDDLCSMQNGRPFPSSAYSEHGFKLLRPGNLAPDGSLSWAKGSTVHLDEKYVQENSGWVVRPGDVVVNLTAQSLEDGFMGRVCLAVEGDDSLLNQRLGRFLCNEGVESEYLYRVLQTSRFRRMVEARCEGSKVRHTYFRHFADLPVVKVTHKEQREIMQAASFIDVARKAAKDSVRDSRALLDRLVNGFIKNGETAHV
ncbi:MULTISPECIES: restriction endonuclease subunit S [Dethiosulfovibrio]|uniref:Restriction endonuclease subunit S n=2 Tax=Dethiosulfovibrio TaxID=47054 RepID=A0ABS9EMG5_9BACT|nr:MULTISPECIES: restriction endonuclease subunit S [Dethiosulfovibrio]MCF4113315.1 restriction endonuclease subunit S [Dethiosulfovibrio russensis]MCF4142379.1 restriction endonuclease subunit S [Dethiosulfovibrio marinus]MCF4145609.1 restriction endonuclease subunit S [Dethiosulfovibrio acidaminovorans]